MLLFFQIGKWHDKLFGGYIDWKELRPKDEKAEIMNDWIKKKATERFLGDWIGGNWIDGDWGKREELKGTGASEKSWRLTLHFWYCWPLSKGNIGGRAGLAFQNRPSNTVPSFYIYPKGLKPRPKSQCWIFVSWLLTQTKVLLPYSKPLV